MSHHVYYLGENVKASVQFTDSNGDAADPTTVTATFTDPSGNETEYTFGVDSELEKTAVGAYEFLITDVDETGLWEYEFEGTGAVVSKSTGSFFVSEKPSSPTGGLDSTYGTEHGVAMLVPMHTDDGDFTASTSPKLFTVRSWLHQLSEAVDYELDRHGYDTPATGHLYNWLSAFVNQEVAAQIRATYAITRRGPTEDEQEELKARELLTNIGKVRELLAGSATITKVGVNYGDPFQVTELSAENEWKRVPNV